MTIIFSDNFDTGFTDSNGLPARDPSKWLEWTDGAELIEDDGSWEILDPKGQLGAGLGLDLGSDAPPDKPWLIRGRIVVDFGRTLKELG